MKKLKGFFKLIRFELPFSAGVCAVLGQLFALGEFASLSITLSGFLSIFFISASILVLNDYYDIETDKVNAPHRPIPSNLVSENEALIFSIALLVCGLALGYSIGVSAFVVALALLLVGFLYNRYFKKSGLPGNLMVSFSVGMTFIFGGLSVELPFNKVVLFFALIAALLDLGEEIAADAMDEKGDRLINSKSLAMKFGKSAALKTSGFIFAAVVFLSFIPFLSNWFSPIYLIPILIMDVAIAYPAYKLHKAQKEEGRKWIRIIYSGATLGLVIFLAMRLIGINI